MFRTAFLGCGPRAKGHARAYEFVTRGRISALCDLDHQRLDAFGEEFGVAARYDDFAKMIETERPDVLHMVTLPGLRVELLTQAVEMGVPAVIVEKPLATDLDQLTAIEALGNRGTKIVVNHQLRFHARFQELLDDVRSGRIGPLRLVDGSCMSKPSEQGSHVMNLLFALNGNAPVRQVQGGCGGPEEIEGGRTKHPAPRDGWAILDFENGVRGLYVCGSGAPTSDHPSVWMHKRAAAFGAAGHVEWSMTGWSRQLYGKGPQRGPVDYRVEDDPAQAALTEAVFDWLEDDTKLHPTRLEISVREASAILAIYASTSRAAPVTLPLEGAEPLLPRLREVLER